MAQTNYLADGEPELEEGSLIRSNLLLRGLGASSTDRTDVPVHCPYASRNEVEVILRQVRGVDADQQNRPIGVVDQR